MRNFIAKLTWALGVFAVGIVAFGPLALAQSTVIVSKQYNLASNYVILAQDCTTAAANRWTGWLQVSDKRNIVLDVEFVDANASAASLDVTCEYSRSSATAQGAGYDLPAITETSNTAATRGTSTMPWQHTWQIVAPNNATANPGTFNTGIYIENIPGPWIACLLTCGAGGAAADTISVFARGINP